MEKDNVVKVAVEEDGVKKPVAEDGVKKPVAVPEEDGVKKPAAGPDQEESVTAPEVCYKKTVGEDATFLDSVKDRLKQLKDTTTDKHIACIRNRLRAARDYASKKASLGSALEKLKIEPEEVKDETPEAAKPAPGAVESH